MLLETTIKYRCDSEEDAKEYIEQYRREANEKGYYIKKAGYEYKAKKSKGEVICEAWIVSVVQVFEELWGDL